MELDEKTVRKVASLARLRLSDEETTKFTSQIGQILKYIDKLNQANTDGIEPLNQVLEIETPLRKDVLREENISQEAMLKSAPEQVFDHFKVPQVMAGKE